MKRNLPLFLLTAAVAAAGLISCGESAASVTETPDTQTASEVVQTEATETEDTVQSLLPEGLDFGGETIRVMNCFYFEGDEFMLETDEATGDVVNDAVYERNVKTESLLNVNFTYEDYNIQTGVSGGSIIRKSVTAGSDDYDLIFGVQYDIVQQVVNNCFLDMSSLQYLNFDQPWWYKDYIDEMQVGTEHIFFATGDITLGVIRNMSCMYVNKDLYQQYFESADEIYEEVLSGKWTFDVMAERCLEMYQDLNGDGTKDQDDRFGMGVITASLCDHFCYDAGMQTTTRDEDNIPTLTINNDHTVALTEKMYNLYYENQGVYVFDPTYDSLDVVMPNKFNSNELLYLPGWFYTSELLRNMEVDYAVIPFPKYDESQESYLSLAHDISTLVCIPSTCQKVDAVSATMEELAFEGYKEVLPAYYEVAIKVKYSRDSSDAAMQILDIIHDNSTTDFAFIYNYALGGVGLIERDLMAGKKSDFVSKYTKSEKTYLKKLTTLIEAFTALDE